MIQTLIIGKSRGAPVCGDFDRLDLVERELGGELLGHYCPDSGWRWAFRDLWRPRVVEITESQVQADAWRILTDEGERPCPEIIRGVLRAGKYLALNPGYRRSESGRLFPDVWTGEFLPQVTSPVAAIVAP